MIVLSLPPRAGITGNALPCGCWESQLRSPCSTASIFLATPSPQSQVIAVRQALGAKLNQTNWVPAGLAAAMVFHCHPTPSVSTFHPSVRSLSHSCSTSVSSSQLPIIPLNSAIFQPRVISGSLDHSQAQLHQRTSLFHRTGLASIQTAGAK